jgi:hypothetical protein
MATAGAKGRPIAALELCAEERAYLDQQVCRRRVSNGPSAPTQLCSEF